MNDSILEDYFKSIRSVISEEYRIKFLELELHKRKLRRIRLVAACKKQRDELLLKLTKDQREAAQGKLKQILESVGEEIKSRRRTEGADDSWILEEEDEVWVFFDIEDQAVPNVVVMYKSNARPSIFVDIAASIKKTLSISDIQL